MGKKVFHDFGEAPTVNKFREVLGGEWLDSQNVPKGTKIYGRKVGVGCWKPAGVSFEDSGVYIEFGEESNPQHAVESKLEAE